MSQGLKRIQYRRSPCKHYVRAYVCAQSNAVTKAAISQYSSTHFAVHNVINPSGILLLWARESRHFCSKLGINLAWFSYSSCHLIPLLLCGERLIGENADLSSTLVCVIPVGSLGGQWVAGRW